MVRDISIFLITALVLAAQWFTGAITGSVTDPSGAAVPNAKLVAVEERSNVSSETTSDAPVAIQAIRGALRDAGRKRFDTMPQKHAARQIGAVSSRFRRIPGSLALAAGGRGRVSASSPG